MFSFTKKEKRDRIAYPRQFWLLFWGVFINRGSVSMLWPFLTVYMYQKLGVPLVTVTLLLTLRAVFSLASTTIVGELMDRIGRKKLMVFSLIASACVFAGMTQGESLLSWAILLACHGVVLPIFNIGVNAMVADIVESEHRPPAYALIRTISNAGIAIGPLVGGFLAIISFELIFFITAIIYMVLSVLVLFMLHETMPDDALIAEEEKTTSGYAYILRDRTFLAFCGAYFLLLMGYTQMFSLLPVYVTENFGLVENEYSLLLTVNATMVVLLQYVVTKFTARFEPYRVIALGTLFYIVGTFSVGLGFSLPHFMLSMAIVTFGELVVTPTATTLVADIAPVNMRARYMGIFALGYPVSSGIGPVIGGFLNDNIAPVAIWYGASVMAILSAITFAFLIYQRNRNTHVISPIGAD